jgi:hypothetical protein
VPERAFTDQELEAAIEALGKPERFRQAQAVIERVAPQLQRVLGLALKEGGWFDEAHESSLIAAAMTADEEERIVVVRTLMAEEARIGMMVGVAVGYELARELKLQDEEGDS